MVETKNGIKPMGAMGVFIMIVVLVLCSIQPPRPVGMTTASIHVFLLISSEFPFPLLQISQIKVGCSQ